MKPRTERIVMVAILAVVVVLFNVVEGNTLKKKKGTTSMLYVKPVGEKRMGGFLSFSKTILSRRDGPMQCTYSVNKQGRIPRMCSTATLILLRAYCQWLLDEGINPLEEFCYKPPFNFV